MNDELTQKLYDKFPELYRGRHLPATETAMCFGFEVGNGWFTLIYDLSVDLMEICKQSGVEVPEVFQVKEKFGGLRFYIYGETQEMRESIALACDKSFTTCEICSEQGKPANIFWRGISRIQILCDKHVKSEQALCDQHGG